jgi:hypothetical protein
MMFAKVCIKNIIIIFLISYTLCIRFQNHYTNNKFEINSEYKEKTSLEFSMRTYAMNLADTKFLKISKNSKHPNEVILTDDVAVLSASVLINSSGKIIFSNEFIDEVDEGKLKGRKLVARAKYTKSLFKIGWSKLYLETFDNCSAEIQSWAAGYLEGKLSAKEILDFYNNLVGIHSKESGYLQDVFDYYNKVEESIRYRTSKPVLANVIKGEDLEYWISVALIQAQTDGLLAGYNSIMKANQMNVAQIYFINADGEVPELLSVFKYKKENASYTNQYSFKEKSHSNKNYSKFSPEYLEHYFGTKNPDRVWDKLMSQSHCSAVIKIINDDQGKVEDVLVGHTTWDSYSEMHRIFKYYKFSYTLFGNLKKTSNISFSSYPGTLTSTDDYYLLNGQIVVLETTLEMLDKNLYGNKIPEAQEYVPNYIRILISNRLAKSGQNWAEYLKRTMVVHIILSG